MNIFRTIRAKLLGSFLMFLLITFFIIWVNIWFKQREDRANDLILTLSKISLENQKAATLARDFFIDETINPQFFTQNVSEYLINRDKHVNSIKGYLSIVKSSPELKADEIRARVDSIIFLFDRYEQLFSETVRNIELRGFKDFGLEGEMRDYIHEVEDAAPYYGLDMGKLLMIRRHEKDFILRKEERYTQKIVKAIQALREDILIKVKEIPVQERLVRLLERYQKTFTDLVAVEKVIGFSTKKGLRKELADVSRKIGKDIEQIDIIVNQEIRSLVRQNRTILIGLVLLFISLIIFLAYIITKILSKPIRYLSRSINHVIQLNFSRNAEFEPLSTRDEIGKLSRDFEFMLQKVQDSIDEIQNKSERIESKQKILMESIRYAQKIQHAILPDTQEMQSYFKEFFIIYQPMHVVSGDFYWLAKVRDYTYIGVVDCTGHGVPGAFMSMIGHSLLNKILIEKQVYDPADILEILDYEVRVVLHQEKTGNNDGMEISLCRIQPSYVASQTYEVVFAGAKGNLYYNRGRGINEIRGSRRAIGGLYTEQKIPKDTQVNFENHTQVLPIGSTIYMSSDGYWDQPNEKRRKLGRQKFMSCLEEAQSLSLRKQKEHLEQLLRDHMTFRTAQRDDITVVGIRL